MNTQDIVQKLWNLCHVLRDDGITYHEYVTELTFLLFLKMTKETGTEDQIPRGYRWNDVEKKDGVELLEFYKKLLIDLGSKGSGRVQAIFANASTSFRQPRHLRTVVDSIDALDWYSAKSEGLGDLYEGLLEKNAEETKSGAGQYFTPRPLIESMVALVKPQPGERVQDPAVGTGGFLINADRYVKAHTDDHHDLSVAKQNFQRREAFYGVELVPDVQRLALMNAMLHDIEGDILLGDTLGPTGAQLPKADVILTNPPFGTKKGGGGPTRDDITYPTSNKQLVFLQHIYRGLKPGGRAAVVLPDNVLFEEGTGQKVRADLMDKCDLHTILRLPTGIFYAQGVKTNVLFFTRGEKDKAGTKAVWIYDMRTNMPSFGKRTPFTRAHFAEFEKAFGEDSLGKSKRKDLGEKGTDGGVVSASSLQANLNGLQWQIDDGGMSLQGQITAGRFVAAVGSKQYSVGATKFVASTGTGGGGPHGNGTYSGLEIGHYAGAKAACETATSTSGHMCSSEELLRSVQSGVFIPDGWYSSGTRNTYTNTGQTWDCGGWNDANAFDYGAWWDSTDLAPGFITCSTENPILCCD